HGGPGLRGLPSPRELRDVLSESDEAKLDSLLRAHRPQFRERLEKLFAGRQAVADAIKAEPFDRAKVAAAFAALREQEADLAAGAQDWLVEFVAGLGPEGRAKVAAVLTRRHKPSDKGPS